MIIENEIVNLNVVFLNLNNIFQISLFTIYIPTINAAFDESIHYMDDSKQFINMLVSYL